MDWKLDGRGLKFAVVVSRFNQEITEKLLAGAQEALRGAGADFPDVFHVPGAFELPLAAKRLLSSGRYHGVVALGAVVRGDTPHFDYVAGEAATGLARVAADTGVPVAFGVLTCNTLEQAIDRAGAKGGNKGFDAAMTAIEMADLLRRLRENAG